MKNQEKQTGIQKLVERLHDPLQFRIFVTGVILAVGYVGVYMPLESRITETTQNLTKTAEYENLVDEVKQLRDEVDQVVARLPTDTDTNEWIQYVIAGVRKLPVKLDNLDSADPRRVGPFEAVVLRVEVRGYYHDLESFVNWVETNERLFRIDAVTVVPMRKGDQLEMEIMLLGLRE